MQGSPSCRFFILGAGASADSGLPTYRGQGRVITTTLENLQTRQGIETIWSDLRELQATQPGPTYQRLEQMLLECNGNAMVVTQNVDGLVRNIDLHGASVIELHGNLKRATCLSCGVETMPTMDVACPVCLVGLLRPHVVLVGEPLDPSLLCEIYSWISKARPSECYIIGTSMQFAYLHEFVRKCCIRGNPCRVIHVNPDPDYVWHQKRIKTICAMGEYRQVLVKRKRDHDKWDSL
jgi:NAD-dependent SIR2 family protein deacetylase